MKKLYVGNLPFTATDDQISQLFGQHGTVHSVALINDRETGRPRGFGFVEVDDDAVQTMIHARSAQTEAARTSAASTHCEPSLQAILPCSLRL